MALTRLPDPSQVDGEACGPALGATGCATGAPIIYILPTYAQFSLQLLGGRISFIEKKVFEKDMWEFMAITNFLILKYVSWTS